MAAWQTSGRSRISHVGGGGRGPVRRGRGPPMQALFSKNVWENERIGCHRGGHVPSTSPPRRSANADCQAVLTLDMLVFGY